MCLKLWILQDAIPRDDAVHRVPGDERLHVQRPHLALAGHKIFCEVKWRQNIVLIDVTRPIMALRYRAIVGAL